MDRLDGMPPEVFDRLHGAIRYLGSAAGGGQRDPDELDQGVVQPDTPWWNPGADASVSPETDYVVIAGVRVARGSRVRMLPGARRADAQDLFLTGREATVQAVFHDVDGNVHVAVSPDRDDLADLQSSHGRYLYFSIDELSPNPLSSREVPEYQEDPP
jgi:hypothetical protein